MTPSTNTIPPIANAPKPDAPRLRVVAYLFPTIAALIVFAAIIVIGLNLWQSRVHTRAETDRNYHSLALAFAHQTARMLQAVDLTLVGVADSLRYSNIDWHRSDDSRIRQIMLEKRDQSPYLRTLFLVDADGQMLHDLNSPQSLPISVADRPYFLAHKERSDLGVYVGQPLPSRLTGNWITPISRRLNRPDGSFNGVISTAIDPAVLRNFYGQLDLGDQSEVILARNDGVLLMRYPDVTGSVKLSLAGSALLGEIASAQPFKAESPVDNHNRIYVRVPVPDSSLHILLGYDESRVLSDWRNNMVAYAIIAPVLITTFGGLSFLLFRYMSRRESVFRALKQSEERFRDFAEAASDRFWETDEEHRYVWHSSMPAVESFIGKTRWERAKIDLQKDAHWRAHKAEIDAHRPFRDFQYSLPGPDGILRYRALSGKPVFGEDGSFHGYRGTYKDITEQVIAREQATMHRDRFLRAIENLPEGFALYDAEDRLVVCNTRYQELFYLALDALEPGTPFETFLRSCLAIGLIVEAQGCEEQWLAKRMADHRSPPNVWEVLRAERWYQIRELRDPDGGTLFFVLDVHAQKSAELQNKALNERIRKQFECMPVACLVLSPDFTVIDWNPAAERIFGYSRGEMLGKSPYHTIIPADGRARVEGIERRLLAGETNVAGHGDNLTKDGRKISCEWFSTPILDDHGRSIGLLCMAMDITERRKTEEKLRQAQRMEAVGQLTGGIAHDFNNLLQVICGNSEILVQGLKNDKRLLRWAEMTKMAAERGALLTQRLLAFSRQQELAPSIIDLKSLLGDFVELLHLTFNSNIEVVTRLDPGLPPLVLDVGQLENALLNLALNAKDAMPGGGRLTIEAKAMTITSESDIDVRPGAYVAISVTDTGTGMLPAVAKRAFEPFFTTKDVDKGSGLGLSMVYGFVTQSCGQIKIDSRVGKGTAVTMFFPQVAAPEVSHPPASRRLGSMPTGKETILVVEDDPMVRSYVTSQLQSLGYVVEEADSGPAALAKLDEIGPVDLLFTDIVMPGQMNGRDLAKEVARRFPATRILFTSGYAENTESGGKFLPRGALLLSKPYRRQDLAWQVRELLDMAG